MDMIDIYVLTVIIDRVILIVVIVMIREVNAVFARKSLGELLNEVQYRHDSILIMKAGKPIAAMVDIHLFQKINLLQEQFSRMTRKLRETYKNVEISIAEDEIAEAIKQVKGT